MKHIYFTTKFIQIILFIFLLFSTNFCFSQVDPWGDEATSIFEESDLYLDNYSKTSRSIYQEPSVSAGGYLGIGVSAPTPPPDPKKVNTPGFPTDPESVSINSAIVFLIIGGLTYGALKTKAKYETIRETETLF
jgi:hypothetical protein